MTLGDIIGKAEPHQRITVHKQVALTNNQWEHYIGYLDVLPHGPFPGYDELDVKYKRIIPHPDTDTLKPFLHHEVLVLRATARGVLEVVI